MDDIGSTPNAIAFFIWLLLLILKSNEDINSLPTVVQEDDTRNPFQPFIEGISEDNEALESFFNSSLQTYQLCSTLHFLDDEMGFWVKPRSTAWFSRFLLEQYDNKQWIYMFRMTKPVVLALLDILKPHVQRHNTPYRLAIPVLIRVASCLFKLCHGANITVCSELFAIGRSTISKILREVVHAINDTLRQEIAWPRGRVLRQKQTQFYSLCGLLGVVGAIDGMHVSISKPQMGAPDYYYFKSGGYTVNCQAVVDSEKRFLDLYLRMSGLTNDSQVLRRSSLFHLASNGTLFQNEEAMDGFRLYLVGDLEYPLLPWLMVPHRSSAAMSLSESIFNRKLRKAQSVVENAFGILKQSFRELLNKTDLHITFVPDVILCCALLHNILLRQSHEDVEDLLNVLQDEGLQPAYLEPELSAGGYVWPSNEFAHSDRETKCGRLWVFT